MGKRLAIVVLAATVATGCEKSGSDKSVTKVEVLDRGSGEQYSLQLDFKPGDVSEVSMDMDMAMSIPGMMSIDMNMDFGYRQEIKRVETKASDRIAHFEITFTKVDMSIEPSAPAVEEMISEFRKLEGLGLLGSMDQRGKQGYLKPAGDRVYPIFKSLGMDQEQVEKMFDDIYPDIPAEPIGVGGSWRINKKTKQNQADVEIDMTYKLVDARKREDGTVECTLDITGNTKVSSGGMSGGGGVKGKVVYVPGRGRIIQGHVETSVSAEKSGQKIDTRMVIDIVEDRFTPGS